MMLRIYTWQDLNGEKHTIAANSLNEAKIELIKQECYFFNLTKKRLFIHYRFQKRELAIITKQLSLMLKAGLPIIDCLTILAEEHPAIHWQWLLNDIKKRIISGDTLSQTVSAYPTIFPPIYKELITTGELTGQLDNSFDYLAMQLENSIKSYQRIKKATRYPLFLLATSLVVTLIMLLVVLPQFIEIYQNFDAKLPPFTQAVIATSEILHNYYIHLSLLFIGFGLIYRYYLKKYYPLTIAKYLLKLPLIGNIITISCLSQIFQTLQVTQKSGIPLLMGLEAARNTVFHQSFKHSLSLMANAIEQGLSFNQAVHQHNIYPALCSQLIRTGEESGTLDIMLERLTDYYQQKSIELTDNLSQKIEPIMMTIMAIIIGTLVIAMYLPVFQLGEIVY